MGLSCLVEVTAGSCWLVAGSDEVVLSRGGHC